MTDVTIEKINVLVKLSIYTIKRFPDLALSNNSLAISTLTKTINNLATVNKNLLQQYLDSIGKQIDLSLILSEQFRKNFIQDNIS